MADVQEDLLREGVMDAETKDLALQLWDFHRVGHQLQRCDVMLVLGSHDIRVAEYAAEVTSNRLARVLRRTLYVPVPVLSRHHARALNLFSSGGVAHTDDLLSTTFRCSEAEAFADRMRACGVPNDSILREPLSKNTGDNFNFTRALLADRDIPLPSRALVVTKPYMERRALATGRVRWPGVELIVTRRLSCNIGMTEYLAGGNKPWQDEVSVMVGDLQRLQKYPDMGFMEPTHIPQRVWAAYERLAEMGFNRHLLK